MSYTQTPARYHGGKRPETKWVTLHTAECAETHTAAEGVASFFATSAPKTSAHATIDDNSVVQCLPWDTVGWHAGSHANTRSVGLEMAGRAAQTAAEWRDAYSVAMLERTAALTAELCVKYKLPVRYATASDLLAGKAGITMHRCWAQAYPHDTTHTDPGPNFPMDYFLSRVRAHLPAAKAAPKAPARHSLTVSKGDTLWSLARRYKVSVAALTAAAGGALIHPGQVISWSDTSSPAPAAATAAPTPTVPASPRPAVTAVPRPAAPSATASPLPAATATAKPTPTYSCVLTVTPKG